MKTSVLFSLVFAATGVGFALFVAGEWSMHSKNEQRARDCAKFVAEDTDHEYFQYYFSVEKSTGKLVWSCADQEMIDKYS